MAPLDGSRYVDLVIHYTPLHFTDWYLQDNPEHSVSPVGNITDCHETTSTTDDGELTFPTVLCVEEKTGRPVELPFLSLQSLMSPLRSGNELYEAWLSLNKEEDQKVEKEVHVME
jgi:hypothetical protein